MNMRVGFAGTPAFAVPALRALAQRHTLVGVLTQPDRPAGRGRALTASPVKELALTLGLPVLQPQRLRGGEAELATTLNTLEQWQLDVLVVVAYGLLLPPAVLQRPRYGCLNIHASLLPRWRGAAPIQRAILAGDTSTGVCIMQMDQGLDTGDVWCQAAIPISADSTAASLHDQLAQLGAQQILLALEVIAAGSARPQPQSTIGINYAAKLSKAEARVDWQGDAVQIDRQIRGLNPWPMAETTWRGEAVKLLRSSVAPAASSNDATLPPGSILGVNDAGLRVACGSGSVTIQELQRAGRRPVLARDFYNGIAPADLSELRFQ